MRALLAPGVLAAALIAGCGGTTPDTAPTTTTAVVSSVSADPGRLDAEFRSANSAEAWFPSVTAVELDGKAVLVRTTLGKNQAEGVVPMCEAARKAAETAGTDFVSVTVRSAEDSSLAAWNKLREDTACAAV